MFPFYNVFVLGTTNCDIELYTTVSFQPVRSDAFFRHFTKIDKIL